MAWIENKCVVITGATSGIGKEIAIRLALLGAHTVLACRDRQLGNVIAADINAKTQPRRAVAMTINTADQRSIRAFASDYYDRYGCLDVLVNNAGVLVPSRQTNADHVELTFATNVLGYFLTTLELLDALTTGTPSRVVNVASTFASDVELDDLQF